MSSVAFVLSFVCPYCGKDRQHVRVGIDNPTGALVVDHPWPDDCDTWRHYAATPRTRAMFVRMALREAVDSLGAAT